MNRKNVLSPFFLTLVALLQFLSSFAYFAREPLSFEERIKAQEAIERVYYSHRNWPENNRTAKPAFENMVSKEHIETVVIDYLKKSAALEEFWRRPISAGQLKAEMERMARDTKDPGTLKELFAALNNDPYIIAECLARPVFSERLIENWYAYDGRLHAETKALAEESLKKISPENFCDVPGAKYNKILYKLEEGNREEESEYDTNEGPAIALTGKQFIKVLSEIPEEGAISKIQEKHDCFVITHTISRNDSEIVIESLAFMKKPLVGWLDTKYPGKPPEVLVDETESYYLPEIAEDSCVEGWHNGILEGEPPQKRLYHTAIWTGNEMIIWGGVDLIEVSEGEYQTVYLGNGGRYNPSTDSWVIMASLNAPSPRLGHRAIWTGIDMIIWGGYFVDDVSQEHFLNTGSRYNPANDNWISTSTGPDCPSERMSHTAIWTGTEMIVWGGYSYNGEILLFNTGGKYDPADDTWTPTSTGENCPSARSDHSAVWTGTEMIVWGGNDNTGGRYNPSANTWTTTSTGIGCPLHGCMAAVWTGTEMIVWGDYDGTNTGGRYNPGSDTWTPTSTGINCPSDRYYATALWTGVEMVVWGGYYVDEYGNNISLNTGGKYDPSTDSWLPTTTLGSQGRTYHTAIWTGSEMIVWGGSSGNEILNTGNRYDSYTDSWITTAASPNYCPSQRAGHTAVWTGVEMIVWGGFNGSWYLSDGGRYNTITDSWIRMDNYGVMTPPSRSNHTAIWTGAEMVVWGGVADNGLGVPYYLRSGGRYNPFTDTWERTSESTYCPSGRECHTAVWTGAEMIVWGGSNGSGSFPVSGGRYNPSTNSWTWTSVGENVPSGRNHHTAVWTGTEMIIWGGYIGGNTGGRYNPSTDEWTATSTGENVPSARRFHTAVWTGTEMIVWGGESENSRLNSGGRYNPAGDIWVSTSAGENCPSERYLHTAVWAGTRMIVWGGSGDPSTYSNYGASYDPVEDSWLPALSDQGPSARAKHTAIWTGKWMIVWGGKNDLYLMSGGRYDTCYCPVITVSPLTLPEGYVGSSYSRQITAGGGTLPYSYEMTGGALPPGLVLSPEGLLSGTFNTPGNYNFTITATDADPHLCAGVMSYNILVTCPLTLSPGTLPGGTVGDLYSQTFTVSGTTGGDYRFYKYTGNFPPGLMFYENGTLTGKPTATGLYNFAVIAWDIVNYCRGIRDYSITVTGDGNLLAWGNNDYGQLGDGTNTGSYIPVLIQNLESISAVAAGSGHTLALKSDGTVWACGLNDHGQLGNGSNTASNVPIQVLNLSNVKAIAGGSWHSLALMNDGTVRAWGNNDYGQLGNGDDTYSDSNVPVQVIGLADVVAVAGSESGEFSLALKNDGTVWAWGNNGHGQLGNGDGGYPTSNVPVQVSDLTGIRAISAGYAHAIALKNDDSVWAWGCNLYGELGIGDDAPSVSNVPVQVPDLGLVSAIACGSRHSLVLKREGSVWSWGYNDQGQLGNGTYYTSKVPRQVSNQSAVIAVAASGSHSMALKYDGTMWSWGHNADGELGNGATTDSNVPVQVSGVSNPIAIAAGGHHSLAITRSCPVINLEPCYGEVTELMGCMFQIQYDAGIWANGGVAPYSFSLTEGSLPPGLVLSDMTPNIGYISGIPTTSGTFNFTVTAKDANDCASSGNYLIVVQEAGPVWSWGGGQYGQLGNGTNVMSDVPVFVIDHVGSPSPPFTDVMAVAGGKEHSVALKSNGTVYAWGRNESGQLGDTTFVDANIPVGVRNLTEVTAISGGGLHSLALRRDGKVWAWGSNDHGQLGNGDDSYSNSNVAVQVSSLAEVIAIAGSQCGNFSLALKTDGTVWAWGSNDQGQLGNGDETHSNSNIPVQVLNLTDVQAISSGASHSLALKTNGTVWAWGSNDHGELGEGTNNQSSIPVQIMGLSEMVAISGGDGFSLALKSDGTVWAWGRNEEGELGDGANTDSNIPVQVSEVSDAAKLVAGGSHSLVIKADGTIWGWGYNGLGELGNGYRIDSNVPVQVLGLANPVAIAAGGYHSLAVIKKRSLQCPEIVLSPEKIPAGFVGDPYSQTITASGGDAPYGFSVSSGSLPAGLVLSTDGLLTGTPTALGIYNFTITAKDVDDCSGYSNYKIIIPPKTSLRSWGNNDVGQLGDGTNVSSNIPVFVLDLEDVTAAAAGGGHSLALKNDGTLWAWGSNTAGQLGNPDIYPENVPVQVSGLTSPISIAAGGVHSLALESDGTVWAWGANWTGQLGDGTNQDSSVPVQVSGLTDVTAIAASDEGGEDFSLALKTDGTVWSWGYNAYGQLGNGTNSSSNIPVQVLNLTGITAIFACPTHSLALKDDGSVWAWGDNSYGGLGNGTNDGSNVPVHVSNLSDATAIAGGQGYSVAIKSNGTVWSWGYNNEGELGNGNNAETNLPVQVSNLTDAVALSAGIFHSLALKSDGTVWAWGDNWYGQLGNGTNTASNVPVQVSGIVAATAVSAGYQHSLAVPASCETPSGQAITGIVDNDGCSPYGITIYFSNGSPASRHDLYVDGSIAVSGVTNPVVYHPGDGLSHSYVIRAVNTYNSCWSDSAPMEFTDVTCPVPPEIATGSSTDDAITFYVSESCPGHFVHWPSDPEIPIYRLYRGTISSLPDLLTAEIDSCRLMEGTGTEFCDTAVPSDGEGRCYWYLVAGVNGAGEGSHGNGTDGQRIVDSSGWCQ